tara:strand:+ start:161 stop:958 length:798 start_codon:yes stop_codon:yes gene_type:complete
MRKETRLFLTKIPDYSVNNSSSSWYRRYDTESIFELFMSYGEAKISRIVSDPYWNRYPSYTSGYTGIRSYGSTIHNVITLISVRSPEVMSIISSKSVGYILCCSLDVTNGKSRINAAKRAKKSKDTRARLRAAKILPVRLIRSMHSDKSSSVRNAVIKRIGLDNCYDLFLNDKDRWISGTAKRCLSIDELPNYREVLSDLLSKDRTYSEDVLVARILGIIPKDELVYFLDIGKEDCSMNQKYKRNYRGDIYDPEKIISSRLSFNK